MIDAEEWHHMGDLGRADADGHVRVTGRLKDIIIRGGTNISAGEVEGHLMAHQPWITSEVLLRKQRVARADWTGRAARI